MWKASASGQSAFGTVAEEWVAAKTPRLKPSTASGYRSLLDHTVLPRWRDAKLADITHSDVQQWVTWMTTSKEARQTRTDDQEKNAQRKPLSARRAVQAHRILKQVLAFAIRTKRLAVNPCDEIELPRVVHREETALTHQQVHALADAREHAGEHEEPQHRPVGWLRHALPSPSPLRSDSAGCD